MDYKLRQVDGEELRGIYRYMRRDFQAAERIPFALILRAIRRGVMECFTVEDELGYAYGYMIATVKSVYGYVLLNYFAIAPRHRGEGVGSAALELLAERYSDRQGIIVELSEFPGEEELTRSRREFYQSNGYRDVPARYMLAGVHTEIMEHPIRSRERVAEVIHRVIPDIYSNIMPEIPRRRIVKIKRHKAN